MPLDGGFIYNLTSQLKDAEGAHIDKIHQPSKYELVLLLRGKSSALRMILSAVNGRTRVGFTQSRPENPENPPMFCMLMRKYFGNSKITDISMADGLERVIKITASGINEMGDTVSTAIYAELIGTTPNIVAVNSDGKIIDAVRRSSLEKEGRMILPGAKYTPVVSLGKIDPLSRSAAELAEKVTQNNDTLFKALLNTLQGLSPLVCRQICFDISLDEDTPARGIDSAAQILLEKRLELLCKQIKNGTPTMVLSADGTPMDFSYMPITVYGTQNRQYADFSTLLDEFYAAREQKERLNHASQDIAKTVHNLMLRAQKRKSMRQSDLKKCRNREEKRIYGELIKANIYNIGAGQTFAQLPNFYDENMREVRIPLDPALSAAKNAEKYFKEYKKSCAAHQILAELIKADEEEIEYLESVADSIKRAETKNDIAEIRQELLSGGYIKGKTEKRKKQTVSAPEKYTSPNGFEVLVGKNNRQNDELTLHTAAKNDIWFHVKNMPGSHTVLVCDGKTPEDEDIMFAAACAAKHSSAAQSNAVPVDYTRVKFVKKPAGAKCGMVIYTSNRTVYVRL